MESKMGWQQVEEEQRKEEAGKGGRQAGRQAGRDGRIEEDSNGSYCSEKTIDAPPPTRAEVGDRRVDLVQEAVLGVSPQAGKQLLLHAAVGQQQSLPPGELLLIQPRAGFQLGEIVQR